MNRIRTAYSTAWNFSSTFGEPLWLQWLWRLIIFGAPLSFIVMSLVYGFTTGLWFLPVMLIIFTISTHPLITSFVYHDFYEMILKRDREWPTQK